MAIEFNPGDMLLLYVTAPQEEQIVVKVIRYKLDNRHPDHTQETVECEIIFKGGEKIQIKELLSPRRAVLDDMIRAGIAKKINDKELLMLML